MYLIYGQDAVGKSIQVKAICEMTEHPLYISMELKNRRLLGLDKLGQQTEQSPFDVMEALVITPDYKIDPIKTYEKLGSIIQDVLNKPDEHDTVVIDGISEIPKYTEKVVLKRLQDAKPEAHIKMIGKDNLAAWAARNNLAHMPMEQLSSWAVLHDKKVFLTSLMTDEYIGEKKVGRCVDAKDRLRKLCDVRVMLTCDGRGRLADFEKVPDGCDGTNPVVIGKGGLAGEFMKRGLL